MKIETNFSLKQYNTFGIDAKASRFIDIQSEEELVEVLQTYPNDSKFILGGGSNMLLTQDIDALVLHINLKGKKIIKEDDQFVWVEGKAGENWHEFVLWTIEQNFGGLENMSLIPGNVGTTPVQNIGAYGTEIKDTFDSCNAIQIDNQVHKIFHKEECKFGYRESVFKQDAKDQYIITSVQFKLTKTNHAIKTSYIKNFVPIFDKYHRIISGKAEKVNIEYDSQLHENGTLELLNTNINKDRALQYTSVGVHKDDLLFMIDSYPIKKFGSQGQQKSFLIALKLAQFDILKKKSGEKPILLLDDIFDKLDETRVEKIVEMVNNDAFGQLFISDTHSERTENIVKTTHQSYKIFSL